MWVNTLSVWVGVCFFNDLCQFLPPNLREHDAILTCEVLDP